MRLDLPDGEWAELASPRKVSDRRRQAWLVAQMDTEAATADLPRIPGPPDANGFPGPDVPDPAHFRGEHMAAQFHSFDLLVLCFVKAWSLPDPVGLDAIEDLDAGTKDALVAACLPLGKELMPNYSPDIDPKAPTSGSTRPPPGSPVERELSEILSSDGTS